MSAIVNSTDDNAAKTEAEAAAPYALLLGSGTPELRQHIAVRAYYLAQRRNFEPGHDVEDWLDAEQQVFEELIRA
jgi:hypothetical protein